MRPILMTCLLIAALAIVAAPATHAADVRLDRAASGAAPATHAANVQLDRTAIGTSDTAPAGDQDGGTPSNVKTAPDQEGDHPPVDHGDAPSHRAPGAPWHQPMDGGPIDLL
jgi:hypothetical protein